jgi:hypothetical protein
VAAGCGTGPVVGGALIDNVDYICFTRSTRTGDWWASRPAGG